MVMKKYVFLFAVACTLFACGEPKETKNADTIIPVVTDSANQAQNLVANDRSQIKDTVFHTALPPVFDGDIIMQNCAAPEAQLVHELMGGKYNHVGLVFTRERDGLLMVLEMQDTMRTTPLTDFVDRSVNGSVCLLRMKDASKVLNEEKTRKLRAAAKAYKKSPFDPVLNWDDSGLYSSELVWKIYNNALNLKLCPTRKVADFNIGLEKQKELKKSYNKQVGNADEAVSIDDIYNSPKLERIYEK